MSRLLRYTCHKNLGSGALRRGQHAAALAELLTAAAIDDSDVTLWYKVGVAAYRSGHYHQARAAFKQVHMLTTRPAPPSNRYTC